MRRKLILSLVGILVLAYGGLITTLATGTNPALGLDLHDIAPVRVARRAALLDLAIADRRFGYPLETLLRARAAGWRITEQPITYHPRDGGQSKVTGSIRGTVRALRDFCGVLVANRELLRRRSR